MARRCEDSRAYYLEKRKAGNYTKVCLPIFHEIHESQTQSLLAPKPITRHLVLSGKDVEPTLDPITNTNLYQNPPRQSYPNELLKHRFMPYGSLVGTGGVKNDKMEVDGEDEVSQVRKGESTGTSPKGSKDAKVKKRKVKGDSPKKSKRAKTLE